MAEGESNKLPGSNESKKKNNEVDYLDSTRSKSASDAIDDAKNKVQTAGKVGKAIGGVIKAIASIPFLGPILIVLLILIIIAIGVYYFVTTIPGLAIGNLKNILQNGIDIVQGWFTTASDAEINEDDIVELANYLEEMEYDLVGYGFIVPNSSSESDYPTYEDLIAEGYSYGVIDYNGDEAYRYYKEDGSVYNGAYYNSLGVLIDNVTGTTETTGHVDGNSIYVDKYGLQRSTENISTNGQGEILGIGNADTTLLRTYLLSDYRIYSIRNLDEGFGETLYSAIKKTFGGYDSGWAKGLLKFYYAENGVATEAWTADFLSELTNGVIDIGDAISIDSSGKKMSIKKGYFNNAITFDISGWADRYGMSLEFLLSLHIATGAPDLVYAMLQNFDTEVQVYLNDSGEAEVEGGYVDLLEDSDTISDIITWDDITDALDEAYDKGLMNIFTHYAATNNDRLTWIDSLGLNKKVCQYLLNALELESPDNCLGTAQDEVIVASSSDINWYNYNLLEEYNITEEADPDVYDDVEEYEAYEFTTDSGEVQNFAMQYITKSIGTDDESYLDDDYSLLSSVAESYGYYSASDADSEDLETKELSASKNTGTGEKSYFTVKRVKQVKTWTAEVDGEEVEFQWVTYKYLFYKTGESAPSKSEATTVYDNPAWYDTVIVEWITREKTTEELVDAGLVTYDEETGTYIYTNSSDTKCSDQEDLSKCCKNCQEYVKKVLKGVANVTDQNYKFYTPYIARVLGSWFRDTYFVIPEGEDTAINDYVNEASRSSSEMSTIENSYGSNGSYVIVDEDYLAETEEYWTAYEMKQDENGEDTDEYQLYHMEADGTTTDTTMEEWLATHGYESQEEAEAAGEVFVKKAKTRTISEIVDNSKNSTAIGDQVIWSAYSFGENGATGWQKIEYGDGNSAVDAVYDQIGGEEAVTNTDDGGFYYNITSTNTVTQTEDAQRSETNATVKWLFKYRKYYLYDGTTDTALTIAEDKEAVITAVVKYLSENRSNGSLTGLGGSSGWTTGNTAKLLGTYGRSALRQTYSTLFASMDSWYSSETTISEDGYDLAEQWLEWQLDMYYSGIVSNYVDSNGNTVEYNGVMLKDITWTIEFDDDGDGTIDRTETRTGDPRNPDLIGTVNITKNSLNAFTILENTKTLAAEYAYRDFKELIVELNYFDKEDLSEKVDSVFTWVLADLSPMGWPTRPWDKQDTDYGALIESSGTYDYLEEINYDPTGLDADSNGEASSEETDTEDEEQETTEETAEEATESSSTSSSFEGYEGGELVSSPVTGKIIEYGTHERTNVYTGETEEVGYIVIQVLNSDEIFTESNVTNNSNDFEASNEEAANGLNLFYEEYEDVCAGYMVTIDGFNLDLNAQDEDGNYGMYEENEVTALYNSNEQSEREANEEAKYNAPFFVNVGGSDGVGSLPSTYTASDDSSTGYYIKEGKYIGTTYTDEESAANAKTTATTTTEDSDEFVYDGPANYMRIMVKDTDYSIIDYVEDFFDIPEDTGTTATGIYGDLEAIDENSTDAEKVRAAVTYFKSMGFTTEAACGIVGNIIAESGLDPELEDPYGLVQWLSDRWTDVSAWIVSQGYNATSFAGQIRAIYEFEYNQMDSALWDELKSLTDVEQAAELFMVYFERCPGTTSYCSATYYYDIGNTYQLCRDRKIFAQNAYEIYMGDDTVGIKDGSVGY